MKIKFPQLFLIMGLVSILAGCMERTDFDYQEPTSGKTADIYFDDSVLESRNAAVYLFKTQNDPDKRYLMFAIPSNDDAKVKRHMKVSANKELILQLFFAPPSYDQICQMAISFVPENKQSYNIIFYSEKTENSFLESFINKKFDKCYVGVGKLVNGKYSPINVKHIDDIIMKKTLVLFRSS